MKSDDPLDLLFAAVRDDAPDTSRAQYGFETRVLARLREERRISWMGWAMRLCPYFAVLALAASGWFYKHRDLIPAGDSLITAVQTAGYPVVSLYLTGTE